MSTTATFKTLDEFSHEIDEMGNHSSEYWDKQVHVVPKSSVVERTEYLTGLCKDKIVLHIGCTGQLDKALLKVAKKCYGIDTQPLDRKDFKQQDLDEMRIGYQGDEEDIAWFKGVELIVCGEVLEHLGNPLNFLYSVSRIYDKVPIVFTVPNAFCSAGSEWLVKRGRENVNNDHVCYYSYTTIKELLRRAGYSIYKHYWYGGKPYISEGLIVLARG